MKAAILGTGSALPDNIVTNEDLSKYVETNDEWITSHTGIKQRHISCDGTSFATAATAVNRALEDAHIKGSELDLIIGATFTPDYLSPNLASQLQGEIGAKCPAFDMNAACSGFLFGLDIACRYVQSGAAKKVLVAASETVSKIVNYKDRSTCVIFGDGAGAAVVSESPDDGVLCSVIGTESDIKHSLEIPGLQGDCPFYKTHEQKESRLVMDGNEVYMFAVRTMTKDIKNALKQANLEASDIDYVVPHQANIRIIEAVSAKLKILLNKFHININKYGNTSAASVPIALDELARSGKLKKGDKVLMCAFGGGFSSGAAIINWAK